MTCVDIIHDLLIASNSILSNVQQCSSRGRFKYLIDFEFHRPTGAMSGKKMKMRFLSSLALASSSLQ
jgi:hypothetical protein